MWDMSFLNVKGWPFRNVYSKFVIFYVQTQIELTVYATIKFWLRRTVVESSSGYFYLVIKTSAISTRIKKKPGQSNGIQTCN